MIAIRVVVVACVCISSAVGFAQNSTKKIRERPSELAARAGTAVAWRENLDVALAEAKKAGKPVFWYVPSLHRSPMDRKDVIDRYMMAGPFSWPTTIAILNRGFVPVRQVASRDDQAKFALKRLEFIEPGYLVLDGDGAELARLDKITTFERLWFEEPLMEFVEGDDPREGERMLASTRDPDLVAGILAWLARDRDKAETSWRTFIEREPESPIAWKLAAELEGHGPLLRGFEVLRSLPVEVVNPSVPRDGSRAPAGVYSEEQLWRRGIDFLVAMRTAFGGIVDSTYDFGGTDSLPNVYVACTAIAGWAVLEHAIASDDAGMRREVRPFFDYVADDANLNPADTDEITWAQLYRVRFYCRMLDANPDDRPVKSALQSAVTALHELQSKNGAWFHEYANPFVTASVLVALRHAERHGVAIELARVERGLKALVSTRSDNGAYAYGMRKGKGNIPSAIGRMALGELALCVWDKGDQAALIHALEKSFDHHEHLEDVRKYDDHANRYGHGGFFFWYDMRARSEAIRQVEDDGKRRQLAAAQRALILSLPEIDGCFVDSHELGRCYGTAMALLALRALDE